MLRVLAVLLTFAPLLAGCSQRTPAEAFLSSAREHAFPADYLDPQSTPEVWDELDTIVGQARVVGIGESRHDAREPFLFKAAMIEHLILDSGFQLVVLEESYAHAEVLDRYITTGQGDLAAALNSLAGWYLWDTVEMTEFLESLREINSTRTPSAQVRLVGMDITAPALGVERVVAYLNRHGDFTELNKADFGLDLHEGDHWPTTWQRYGSLDETRRTMIANSYEELLSLLTARSDALIASSSEGEYQQMLLYARIGQQGNQLFFSTDRAQGGSIREQGMADIVLHHLADVYPESRAILWTHNLHAATTPFRMPVMGEASFEPMAMILDAALSEDYVAIGASFGTGQYDANLPPGAREFPLMSAESVDGMLAQVSDRPFLLGFGDLSTAASSWLDAEREWRAQDVAAFMIPAAGFDAVFYVPSVSQVTHTPLALERFASLGG